MAGKTAAQMQAIASASVPPEWYVVSTLLGLWIGFIGAPWLASRTQGTRNFVRDLGLRFRVIDLLGIPIGIGGQILVGHHVRARSSTTSTTSTGRPSG